MIFRNISKRREIGKIKLHHRCKDSSVVYSRMFLTLYKQTKKYLYFDKYKVLILYIYDIYTYRFYI